MKKVVIFGGGSGLSQLLKGLVELPLEITAVVSMADNGSSTGELRKEFSIPAVGDITKVLMAMSGKSQEVKDLFSYRFDSRIGGHSIKNLIMTASLELYGDFAHSLPILCDLLDVRGNLYPVTEDNVNLIGTTQDGRRIVGEAEITEARSSIAKLEYDKPVHVNPRVLEKTAEADLIIFSSGSLVTSIMPHIIIPEVQRAVGLAQAKKLYVCNILTQPGETDGYTVSDHIKALETYLRPGCIDAVAANNAPLPAPMLALARSEGKDPVRVDRENLAAMGVRLLESPLWEVSENSLRHDTEQTAALIYQYIMQK